MNIKLRLIIMNFLQFAVWGSYLTSMGSYLVNVNLAGHIGIFYAMQGIVSLFMPAIMGIIADRWVPAQKLLSFSHFMAAIFMGLAGYYGMTSGQDVEFGPLFGLYALSVAFYMPTLALSNSVAYTALDKAGLDTIKHFPPIRIFGTIGFICAMWLVDILGLQNNYGQFFTCAIIGLVYGCYALTLPACPTSKGGQNKSLVEALGLRAFTLFKQKKMAIFFIFSMLLGVSLQITNGFANPYISSFGSIPEYADTFGVQHANILISLSHAWVLRFGLFGAGNPGSGVWMFLLSMIVYGVAFDFFNISGSLFVDRETDKEIRSSAQGLFIIMTNGLGATIGTLGAQAVVNHFVDFSSELPQTGQWQLVVAVVFAFVFKYKHEPKKM